MKHIFRLPLEFFRICWLQGIARALMLVKATFREWGFTLHQTAGHPFPAIPSNSFSYLDILKNRPLVSIVMPVYNSAWLKEAVESVLSQTYPEFELILVDDCSTAPKTLETLENLDGNRRVKILRNTKNMGISAGTNVGIEAASGEYIAFMDHDDLLHPDALALFTRTINSGEDADVFYTDEERIDKNGHVVAHMRKCKASMDLLLSCNMPLHFCIIKTSSLRQLGPLNPEYDGAQDHDLMIRALEAGMKFCHMPYILYAWRIHGTSSSSDTRSGALDGTTYPKAYISGKKLISAYLERNNINAQVTDDAYPWYRVMYELPTDNEPVAILIPFRDKPDYLTKLLASIQQTDYDNYRLYLINNRSESEETLRYLETLKSESRVTIIDFDEPFNYSRLYNKTIEALKEEIILLMNNDIEIKHPEWLRAMLEHVHRKDVGAVGCRLIRNDRSIQHAGMCFKPAIFSCAMNLYFEEEYYTKTQREVSGVTAACMMIRKSVFQRVGGFDEIHFPIGFSDADLCLKIRKAGYKIIYTPFAELYHHESATRKTHEESYEIYNLFKKYAGNSFMTDSHYHTMFMN